MASSVAVFYLSSLVEHLEKHNILEQTLERASLKSSLLNDSDNRISFQQYLTFWNIAVELSQDALLGLRVGSHFHPGQFGALASIIVTAPSLLHAIEELIHFEHVVNEHPKLTRLCI